MMKTTSQELPGLQIILDRLVYHQDDMLSEERPHAFIYFLTIRNLSDREVTILGRKWIISYQNGSTEVLEGDKVVGETPKIPSGESFSYNSYHTLDCDASATGALYGIDEFDTPIHAFIPALEMKIPSIKD